jgi:lipopolysaccharide transport system ATP-binding protein
VASLLEIGTGFHPELTGRENLYLSGSILGMTRREIHRKFDEMVAFADVATFIDTPVKRYSSGMYVRLAFAVAAHLEPEILLVDEVLAVGDMEFQKKCLGKMGAVAREGRTVLFVSHNMGAITRLCRQALWMDSGSVRATGPTDDVVSQYVLSMASTAGERRWPGGIANSGVTDMKIHSVCIQDQDGNVTSTVQPSQPFSVLITYSVTRRLPFCRIGIILRTGEGTTVFESYHSDNEQYSGPHDPGNYTLACEIPANLLATTRYLLTINAGISGIQNLAFLDGVLSFDVEDTGAVGAHMCARRDGVVRPRLNWEREVI